MSSPLSRTARLSALPVAAALGLGVLAVTPTAEALTSTTTANSASVFINDARRPGLDTGSIRNVTGSRLEGLGNLFVHVDGPDAPRMNDQMMRGFGLTGANGTWVSTQGVRLADVVMTRTVQVQAATNRTSFFDTFTNTATQPVTFDVSFGGSLGYGTGAGAGTISATGSGDQAVDPADRWVTATSTGNTRPTGVVVGGGVEALGDQQADPFTTAYTPTGSRANDLGFVRELTLAPGETSSLMQYVVLGALGDTSAIATDTAALAAAPDFSGLTLDQICTIDNWDLASYAAACAGAEPLAMPATEADVEHTTAVAYDVTGKTIADLQADMSAGKVSSVQVTKAYLDRIDAYDGGALGFHAFITVAKDAVAQAMAADTARKAGRTGDLLGVPIALKDLYDTKDMATSGGTLTLKNWQPGADAWQVAKLREAGAVIIGKTNLSEFANSGSFSESGFKQTWNALYPSKTSFGSSGGSATAVGADLAPAAMGTQTGVSLYAPTTGASLATFRGTDGVASADGVMPLTWATDYAGPIAKDVTDLASLLDATATQTTGNNPDDLLTTRVDNAKRPTSYKAALDVNALRGKVIGYVPGSFQSSQITDDTTGSTVLAQVTAALAAAGATMVPMTGAPTAPPSASFPTTGNAGAEGWERYQAVKRPATFPLTTEQLFESPANLPYNVTANYTAQPMDDTSVTNLLARRDAYKASAATWMDSNAAQPVDAVIYAGFLTGVGNNDASSAIFSSDRGTGVLTQTIGLPTAIVPVGTNAEGQSNSIQIVGRAFQDARVLGMGYALEQQTKAQIRTAFAPALPWSGPAASATSLRLATPGTTFGTATTATVSVAADPEATGTVGVAVAGRTVTGTLAAGTVTVTLPADLPVGTHLVTASYGGSPAVAGSAATATLKVSRVAPSVGLRLVKKTVKPWKRGKLVIGVSPVSTTPSTVLVYDGRTLLATRTVAGSGRLALPKLSVGKHKIHVLVVAGPDQEAATSSTVVLRVKR